MSHYDGPAFYRKMAKLRQQTKPKQVIDASADSVVVSTPPVKQRTPKPVQPAAPKAKHKPVQPSDAANDAVTAFRNSAKAHVITYKRAMGEQRFYAQLLQALQKSADSYYLLASKSQRYEANNQTAPHQNVVSENPGTAVAEPSAMKQPDERPRPDASTHQAPSHDVKEDAQQPHQPLVQPVQTAANAENAPKKTLEPDQPVQNRPAFAQNTANDTTENTPPLPKITPSNAASAGTGQATPVIHADPVPKTVAPDSTASKPADIASKLDGSVVKPDHAQTIAQRQAEKLKAQLAQSVPASASVAAAGPKAPVESDQHSKTDTVAGPTAPLYDQDQEKEVGEAHRYQLPPLSLLPTGTLNQQPEMANWALDQQQVLNETLKAFHVAGSVTKYTVGPTVTQFEVALQRGVKVNKITNLTDDLRLALAAKDIRIEAPIPGRSTVGIEIPNLHSRPVLLSEVLGSQAFIQSASPLTVALGVNLFGQPIIGDIAKMPHALIAGSTGSGKSVFINSLLTSILYKATPQQVKLLLIDPKVVELAPYNGLPHLLAPVISDTREAAAALAWTVDEMEKRYQRFAAAGVRNMTQFNQKAQAQGKISLKMPYIVLIIDELADLMMTASNDVQDSIARITQKARAAGIHLIVATQRPSVDVVTGTIKNNIPTRLAFMVSSQIDSRTILDTSGAERLLGKGDMLYLGSGQNHPVRLQGTFIDNEIDAVIDFVKQQEGTAYQFKASDLLKKSIAKSQEDDFMPEILAYLATEKTISTSKLQRTFSIGYPRAASIMDDLEAHNYVGQASGSKPREVFFSPTDLNAIQESK